MLSSDSPYERAHAYINDEIARRMGWQPGWEEEVREWDNRAFEIEVQYFIPRAHRAGFFGDRAPAPLAVWEMDIVGTLCKRYPI
jgi:hypothetical protein